MNRDDVPRLLGRVYLLAEFGNVIVNRTAERKSVVSPDFLEELVAGNHFAFVQSEVFEYFELPRREFQRATRLPGFVPTEVQLDIAKTVFVNKIFGVSAAELRANASEQLLDAEGLGNVIVSAALEANNFVHLLAARRKHDDRRLDTLPAKMVADIQPAEFGQHDVEQDQIGLGLECLLDSRFAILRDDYLVSLVLAVVAQSKLQVGLIFNY
jgi:hypothetical protein